MIKNQQYGNHQNILVAEFGEGDVHFVNASMEKDGVTNHLIFVNEKDLPVEMWNVKHGEAAHFGNIKNSDEIPVKFVMVFNNSRCISSLIASLIDIQMQLQNKEFPQADCTNCGLLLNSPFYENQNPNSESDERFCNADCEKNFHIKHS